MFALYYESMCRLNLGMRHKTAIPAATFKALFNELIPWSLI